MQRIYGETQYKSKKKARNKIATGSK